MRRRQSFTHLLVIVILIGLCSSAMAQGTLEDYVRAEKFLPKNVEKLVYNLRVNPNWIDEDGSRLWYRIRTRQGEKFILVNPEKKAQKPAFDHTQLAISLSKAMGKTVKPLELPFERFEYIEKGKAIKFKIEKDNWTCNLKTYECKKIDPDEPENPSESVSPNEKWIAFVKDFNLYIRLKATGEEFQLTTDGEDKYDYATTLSWYKLFNESQPEKDKPRISVRWSPDSRRLITLRSDRRKAKKLYLYQSMPEKGYRAVVYSYERALPGEKDLTMTEHVIFDVEAKKMIPVDLEPYASHLSGNPRWFKDSKRLYFTKTYRGYQAVDLMEIDAATGKTRVIIEERSTTNVDPTMMDMHMVQDGTVVLWTSERDGWNHIYLYDVKTGELKNQVTKGEFVVRNIAHVDEKARVIYFIASGRRKDRDPYFRHLYRVNFDGT
ncbi:MAG: DPP IV N-terminal domain-containing protein, partial [Candidatus Aminicenantes bacterium]|nr:DPP IV N-terminal domain-containing protein [Candidatus Aminicenantes bacterium]